MSRDYERIGMQTVLEQLIKDIKGKADYLQTHSLAYGSKLKALNDIETMSMEAQAIMKKLTK